MASISAVANSDPLVLIARSALDLLDDRPDPLVAIERVAQMRQRVEESIEQHVYDARVSGHGWDEIASALGITRQGAWQRYRSQQGEQSRSTSQTFLQSPEIWSLLLLGMAPGRWYELQDLYQLISDGATLTAADFEPDAPRSQSPRWQRNVRNVLQRRKLHGDVDWDGEARYRLR